MGGDGQSLQNVTQQAQIPGFLSQLLNQGAATATGSLGRLESTLGGATGEDLVAGFDPAQIEAQGLLEGIARGEGGFLPTAQQGLLETARGDFLFGGPGFDAAVNASLDLAQPRISSAFGLAGGRNDPLAGVALQREASNAFANLFSQERNRQLGALEALPGIAQIGPGILSGVGAERRGLEQQRIAAPISAEQALLQSSLSGLPIENLLGRSTTTQETFSGDELLGNLGGILTGSSALLSALGLGGGPGGGRLGSLASGSPATANVLESLGLIPGLPEASIFADAGVTGPALAAAGAGAGIAGLTAAQTASLGPLAQSFTSAVLPATPGLGGLGAAAAGIPLSALAAFGGIGALPLFMPGGLLGPSKDTGTPEEKGAANVQFAEQANQVARALGLTEVTTNAQSGPEAIAIIQQQINAAFASGQLSDAQIRDAIAGFGGMFVNPAEGQTGE